MKKVGTAKQPSYKQPSPVVNWGTAFCKVQGETEILRNFTPPHQFYVFARVSTVHLSCPPLAAVKVSSRTAEVILTSRRGKKSFLEVGNFSFAQNWTDGGRHGQKTKQNIRVDFYDPNLFKNFCEKAWTT